MKVTVDVFSGRPNPTWIVPDEEAQSMLKEIALNRSMISKPEETKQGLGYRSTLIQMTDESSAATYNLPDRFAIAGHASGNESKGLEIAQRLSEQMDKGVYLGDTAAFTPELKATVLDQIKKAADFKAVPLPVPIPLPAVPTNCPHEVNVFSPTFWNGSDHVTHNNCYNYANNRRTDTFAQPGKATGHQYHSLNCADVSAGAKSDGLHDANNCLASSEVRRYLVALVIWPNVDYHWYRQSTGGHWTHKPGGTPALDHDNSNHPITDPRYCDRGGYTQFCAFYLTGKSVKVL